MGCLHMCPDLRALQLPQDLPDDHMLQIPILISKWKNLEILWLGGTFQMQEVLAQINIHCKNFIGLAIARAHVEQDEASAIVTLLPNIKQLFLRHAYIEKESLVMILQGCKELEYFDVRHCIGFDEGDDEIFKLASRIRTFKDEGSMLYDYDDDYFPTCPNLIVLELPADIDHDVVSKVPKLTSNWKCLEFLRFGTTFKMKEILAQISIHCKNFAGFSVSHADIKKDEATSIVTSVPNIEYLGLRNSNIDRESLLMILKGCKKLVYFDVRTAKVSTLEIIYQISIHCNNFVGLGVPNAYIGKSDASAIATLLPNIKELDLRCANIEKESLVMILKGCKELEYVDVSDCEGFDERDIDILKLASHIRTFKPEGSMLFDSDDDKERDNDGFDLDLMLSRAGTRSSVRLSARAYGQNQGITLERKKNTARADELQNKVLGDGKSRSSVKTPARAETQQRRARSSVKTSARA
ncbi:hypothetical protein HYC85_024125 [Camellia sinensis]|uniref:Uncharacterized protein n=1 Tax=Camellia sinensis TaxID=4442 RepID=A0A7J7G795_CAMSI|nr:hypothetical protein HYC85_024125 [Camellia sinensis]